MSIVNGHIKIVSKQFAVSGNVFYVSKDGVQTDISDCIEKVEHHIHAGDMSRTTLHCIGTIINTVEE